MFSKPDLHGCHRFFPQRGRALLTALAVAVHMGASAKHHILTAQSDEL
jgi:hypothetical protein